MLTGYFLEALIQDIHVESSQCIVLDVAYVSSVYYN